MRLKIKYSLIALPLIVNLCNASPGMSSNEYEITFDNNSVDNHINKTHNTSQYNKNSIVKTPDQIFKECIFRSNNLIETLDYFKNQKQEERIPALYNSSYWASLITEEEKTKTLKIMAQIDGVSDSKYVIIKGKIAEIYKQECFNIIEK